MERIAVESSAVDAIGYDAEAQTLEVQFKPDRNGRAAVWQYAPVSQEAYDAIMQPGVSIGRTLHESVKRNESILAVDVTPEYAS